MTECTREEQEEFTVERNIRISARIKANSLQEAKDILKELTDNVDGVKDLEKRIPKDSYWATEWDYNEEYEEW